MGNKGYEEFRGGGEQTRCSMGNVGMASEYKQITNFPPFVFIQIASDHKGLS